MANDHLISKWKTWYKSLDVNHDGKISMEDVEESRNKFSDLHHLDPEKAKKVKDNFAKWWEHFIFRGKTGEISETEFVASLNQDYSADKDKFKEQMKNCFTTLFEVIDTNRDRSISEDEFLIAFKAYGHENVALDTSFFKKYNPKKNLVPLGDIVDSWIQFVCDEDSSKRDVVMEGFASGV